MTAWLEEDKVADKLSLLRPCTTYKNAQVSFKILEDICRSPPVGMSCLSGVRRLLERPLLPPHKAQIQAQVLAEDRLPLITTRRELSSVCLTSI